MCRPLLSFAGYLLSLVIRIVHQRLAWVVVQKKVHQQYVTSVFSMMNMLHRMLLKLKYVMIVLLTERMKSQCIHWDVLVKTNIKLWMRVILVLLSSVLWILRAVSRYNIHLWPWSVIFSFRKGMTYWETIVVACFLFSCCMCIWPTVKALLVAFVLFCWLKLNSSIAIICIIFVMQLSIANFYISNNLTNLVRNGAINIGSQLAFYLLCNYFFFFFLICKILQLIHVMVFLRLHVFFTGNIIFDIGWNVLCFLLNGKTYYWLLESPTSTNWPVNMSFHPACFGACLCSCFSMLFCQCSLSFHFIINIG